MYTKINDETYEVSTNLGTAYELEKSSIKKSQILHPVSMILTLNKQLMFFILVLKEKTHQFLKKILKQCLWKAKMLALWI